MCAAQVVVPEAPTPDKLDRYKKQLEKLPASAVDVLIAGDSLASMWPKTSLRATFEDCRITKMSMTGDRIQNTLWKVRSGDFDRVKPRMIVLIVGTNNLPKGSPPAIAAAIDAVVGEMIARWSPEAIFVVGIPPRGPKGTFKTVRRKKTNELTGVAVTSRPNVYFCDVDAALGGDTAAYHSDLVHLSDHGYTLMSIVVKSAYLEFRSAKVAADLAEARRSRIATSEKKRDGAAARSGRAFEAPSSKEPPARHAPPAAPRSFLDRLVYLVLGR